MCWSAVDCCRSNSVYFKLKIISSYCDGTTVGVRSNHYKITS
ncbi:unnamed protein product [Nezara viridula]|uniref:Uncharacterized protein n=1 Tax=Nezara viridula TaxID=85310 RepID=A0A9P0H2J5_NEZVI|nr:unnamed protein product [Nezara viridula]